MVAIDSGTDQPLQICRLIRQPDKRGFKPFTS